MWIQDANFSNAGGSNRNQLIYRDSSSCSSLVLEPHQDVSFSQVYNFYKFDNRKEMAGMLSALVRYSFVGCIFSCIG